MDSSSYQWQDDETPPPKVAAYLNNLVAVDGTNISDVEFAERHDVARKTLYRWKQDPRFRKLWVERADASVLGPEALAPLYKAALKIAADPDHPKWAEASNMILKLADKIRPQQLEVKVTPEDRFSGMSDGELAAFLNRAPTPVAALDAGPVGGGAPVVPIDEAVVIDVD